MSPEVPARLTPKIDKEKSCVVAESVRALYIGITRLKDSGLKGSGNPHVAACHCTQKLPTAPRAHQQSFYLLLQNFVVVQSSSERMITVALIFNPDTPKPEVSSLQVTAEALLRVVAESSQRHILVEQQSSEVVSICEGFTDSDAFPVVRYIA